MGLRFFKMFNGDESKTVNVDAANTARTTATVVAATQNIDATGKIAPAGEVVGNAPFTKVTDGTNTLSLTAADTARTTSTLVLPVQIVDAQGKIRVKTINSVHAEIHAGNHFTAEHLFTSVAKNANADIRILNGSTKELHVTFGVACEGPAYLYVYEGTTYSVNGTAVTAYNNKRSSATATTATLYHTPTVDVLGTAIHAGEYIPGGTRGGLTGASAESRSELIMQASTDYLIRLTCVQTAGTVDCSLELGWYEETI